MGSSERFSRILAAEIDGRTQNIRYRQNQFHRLQSAFLGHIQELKDAILADSGNSVEEVEVEIFLALKEVREHYLSLDLDKALEAEYRVANGKDNIGQRTGAGIVYIVPSMHTLFYSVIAPLSAALAAGNCIIVELPRNTMSTVALLQTLLSEALDADIFAVSEERADTQFLNRAIVVFQQYSDQPSLSRCLISPSTSRTVAVVDRTANINDAARLLVSARFALGGRSPYAPDVVLVNEYVLQPFLAAAVQHTSKYLAEQKGNRKNSVQGGQRGSTRSVLEQVKKEAGTRIVVSGINGSVVELQDRSSSLLGTKIEQSLLLVHPISSLDDAIDLSNSGGTLAAAYAFSSLAAGKYLTQFIDAHVSFINHVPYEMLLGPAIPINASVNLRTRYSTDQFEVPRPQIVTKTPATELIEAAVNKAELQKSTQMWREVMAPLPPTKQKPGKKIGFFEQGIITGGIITLFSLVTMASTIGFYGLSFARRLRG